MFLLTSGLEGVSMRTKRFILSSSRSNCHGAPALLVKSKDGGLISRNCLDCKKPYSVSLSDLPALECEKCGTRLTASQDAHMNYAYSCEKCKISWSLPEMLPKWNELG